MNHDIKSDDYYIENKKMIAMFFKNYDFPDTDYDNNVYGKFINENIGFGLFAKRKLNKGAIIIEYVGEIQRSSDYSVYSWKYLSHFKNKKAIIIEGKKKCNLARFANDLEVHNAQAVYLPFDNQWRIYYFATQDI